MATVLDRLGFAAELTPGAKDGGKDVILTLDTADGRQTYVVECKPWRADKSARAPCAISSR
jgi:restriction system protein